MKPLRTPLLVLAALSGAAVSAYPPAPFHLIHGTVRDDRGNPLGGGDGIVILIGPEDREIVRAPTSVGTLPGINYRLSVPMDAGVLSQPYTGAALRSAYPFTLRVLRGTTSYVPLEMKGTAWTAGEPAGTTRIDLTLGIDSDGDGLPDEWEYEMIRSDTTGRLKTLADITADGDADGDGLSNYHEYISGTYANDPSDGISLRIESVSAGIARLRFLAIAKRTYRLKSGTDLKHFSDQSFSLDPASAASSSASAWTPDVTAWVDIYTSVGDSPSKLFRLHVE